MTDAEEYLEWDEVQPLANAMFDVWEGHPELRFAEEAWLGLRSQGLCSYRNELERSRVIVRFLALGALYRDFCQLAWDETVENEYSSWIDEAGSQDLLPPFRVGQLVGKGASPDEYGNEALEVSLKQLADESRAEVHAALLKAFGGVPELFLALWKSNRPQRAPGSRQTAGASADAQEGREAEEEEPESDYDILNPPGFSDRTRAYTWVQDGCAAL
jgi:hypothetical protein